tara:strand:- start:1209 stop:2465 length:1257 start_codon:yes stop_codon:yes gene_type:complete
MIEELKNTFEKFNKKISEKNQIKKIRLENFNEFAKLGFPNKRLEDWKFSDFNKIISEFNRISSNPYEESDIKFDNYIEQFEHNKIVFINGFYKKHSFEYENDEKIIFDNLKNGPAYTPNGNNSLNLLNNAFFTDGLLLNIKKGYHFKKPLVIYNIFKANKENNFFNQKLIVNLEENSKLDLFTNNLNLNSTPIFLNTSNFFHIEKYALFKLFQTNELIKQDLNYNLNEINVLENGVFENFIFNFNNAFYKNDISCNLKEDYSSAFINGAIFADNNAQQEIKALINHNGENTKSYQKVKSVLDKNSKAIFQGKIYVDSNAQKTDGYQLSKAILLDQKSEFDSKPELEIYADDVKCSHGSSSGNLDENSIFYLMSRGLSRPEAKKLIVSGFLKDAIETITVKEIKNFFSNRLEVLLNEYR